MSFDYGELRTKAEAIVQIPEHYRLEMEANTRDGQERSFIWEDPGNDDCQIEITLDIETG